MQKHSPLLIFRATVLAILAMPVAAAANITFSLTATADNAGATPAYDCTGDSVYKFPFVPSSLLPSTGTMQSGSCNLKGPIPLHRAFYLQSLAAGGQQQEKVFYNVNTVTGAIDGNSLLRQNALFFNGYSMSYGVSHAAPPITDQAYVYTGSTRERWMEGLQKDIPNLQIADLVLPGSHDAGMYTMNVHDIAAAVGRMCKLGSVIETICKAGGTLGSQVLANMALTQKDTTAAQLSLGTRFFDFRPAYDDKHDAYHIHNFIPGVSFDQFLSEVNAFLLMATKEVVFVQITHSGIDTKLFTPLSKQEVEWALSQRISSQVGFTVVDSIDSFNSRLLTEVAGAGKRVIVIYGKTNVNDSYSDDAYSQSLTDASGVIQALDQALANCSSASYQYNVLQLQDTGSAALEHYTGDIAKHLTAWANNLLASGTGSILQATKPIFDRSTYGWLTNSPTLTGFGQCRAPVVLLNDFVDPALASRAEALTRYRNGARPAPSAREISMRPTKYYLKTVEEGRLMLSYDNQRATFYLENLPGGQFALMDATSRKYFCLGEQNMLFAVGDVPAPNCHFEMVPTGKGPHEFGLKASNGLYLRRYSGGRVAANDKNLGEWNLCYLH